MTDTRPEVCVACVADPKAAPGRWCAPRACLCGHPECWAFDSYQPRKRPEMPPNVTPLIHWKQAS